MASDQLDTFAVYVHLTPTTHPDQICETLKLNLTKAPNSDSAAEESKIAASSTRGDLVNDLVTKVREFLSKSRNDGNKVYEVLAVSPPFMGVPAPLGLAASSIFCEGSDVYATVRVTVDSKRHVAPISSAPVTGNVSQAATASLPGGASSITPPTS